MGAEWSAPSGRAEIPSSLLPFTAWGKDDLWMMRRRHKASLGGIFALKPEHFSQLLGIHRRTSDIIFEEIFDTDANGLVDAFEFMCGMTLLCSASLAEKVDFAHSLFDFGLDGDLNLAEVTVLLRTVLFAGAKIDRRVQVSPTETLEELCCLAFDQVGVDHEGALAKHLFESFLFRNQQMTAFLQLWSGSASQVLIPKGTLWEDPDFPADQSSLYLHEGLCPLSLPPSGTVQWLRPCEIAKGDQVVLFAGNLPGDCPLVPGQLADRWLLSAIAILTGRPQLLRSLFLHTGQEDQGRHCVRIFKSANWINVFVDSRIPCGLDEKVLFFHGEERHELWGYILEKAFAKAHGCYENLMHGETSEALRDLTGGVTERLQWAKISCSSVAPTAAEPQAMSPSSTDIECGEAKSCIRLTGWGLPPGATQSPEWIFDEMNNRILDGQVLGCSRQAWMRDPWGDEQDETSTAIAKEDGGHTGKQRDTGCGSTSFGGGGKLFPLSNRIMRGLSSGVAYCVLEVFEIGGTRLVRLKDPWSGRVFGTEPGQYLGDWGPSSSLWSKNPALASKLLPRTLPGMFWMDLDDFLEVFNTLYAVDLAGDVDGQTPTIDHMAVSKEKGLGNKRVKKNREGRCEGSWNGGVCGGRFTEGSGWLEGTQAFLQIEPCLSKQPGRLEHPPSEIKAKKSEDRLACVLITLTQEDSRYHGKDYSSREERSRSIGFLVHSYKWSTESSGKIPKLSKIVQEGLNHVTQRFVPKRDVSCRLELPPGQYVIVPTTLEPGASGRFWIHVKSDQNAILVQASAPDAAVTGSNPGECEMRLEEIIGISLDVVYNEAEEDAEGNARTANMASIAGLCSQLMSVALP